MDNVTFIATHEGSQYESLSTSLSANFRIQVFDTQRVYKHFSSLKTLTANEHKNSTSAKIYLDCLKYNYQIASKNFYNWCKFIYFIRDAKPSLNLLVNASSYTEESAYRYYIFRLRRICEMAKRTPGAILMTWENLANGRGKDLIEEYLVLNEPLNFSHLNYQTEDKVSNDLVKKAQDSYERHLYFLKNLDLRKVD